MVIFSTPVPAYDDGNTFSPYARYVVPISQAQRIEFGLSKQQRKPTENSNFNSYERRYGGQSLDGKKIGIYRHTAFGDQLMLSGLTAYLAKTYPTAHIMYFCGRHVSEIWHHNPDVALYPDTMPLESALACDYHLFYESMLECNGLQEQNNAYDDMFAFGGMTDIAPEFKRPHVYLGDDDMKLDEQWRARMKGVPYIVYQWQSGNPVRTYPPDLAAKLLTQWTDTKVVVVGKTQDQIPEHPNIINLVNKTATFRSLIPIIRQSQCVVCPDSSIGHLAGAFPEVKVVSLWGPFHPDDRVKYYANHVPLTGRCPHGPCRTHGFLPPHKQCRDVGAEFFREKQCAALATLSPQDIIATISNSIN